MRKDPEILNYLSKPENIRLIFEIIDYLPLIKEEGVPRFWYEFIRQLGNHLETGELAFPWKLIPGDPLKMKGAWYQVDLMPCEGTFSEENYLHFRFGHGTKTDYTLYWGIRWNKRPESFTHPKIQLLDQALVARGVKETYEQNGWIRHGYYPNWNLTDNEVSYRIYTEPEEFVKEVFGVLWPYFIELQSMVGEINRAVKNDHTRPDSR